MFQINNLSIRQINLASVIKRMLIGAFIGFAIISFFVFSVKNPNPNWGSLWMIRPLIVTPLFGAVGMLFFYSPILFQIQVSWKKIITLIFSALAFIFCLWVGIILGLDGTLWN
jgi:hypothetical protein